jgi:hypothetical protein
VPGEREDVVVGGVDGRRAHAGEDLRGAGRGVEVELDVEAAAAAAAAGDHRALRDHQVGPAAAADLGQLHAVRGAAPPAVELGEGLALGVAVPGHPQQALHLGHDVHALGGVLRGGALLGVVGWVEGRFRGHRASSSTHRLRG